MSNLPEVSKSRFSFSRARDRWLLKMFLVLLPFLFVASFGFSLVLTRLNIAESLRMGTITFVATVLIIAVEFPFLARFYRTQRVLLFEDRLVRESGKIREPIRWGEITRVERIENAEGSILTLRLYPVGRRRIDLSGFEEMDVLDRLVRTELVPSVLYQTRRLPPYGKIVIRGVLGGVGVMVVFGALFLTGMLLDVLPLLIAPVGPYLLIARPMTSYDPRFKWFEVVFGIFLILNGFFLGYMAYRFRFS